MDSCDLVVNTCIMGESQIFFSVKSCEYVGSPNVMELWLHAILMLVVGQGQSLRKKVVYFLRNSNLISLNESNNDFIIYFIFRSFSTTETYGKTVHTIIKRCWGLITLNAFSLKLSSSLKFQKNGWCVTRFLKRFN